MIDDTETPFTQTDALSRRLRHALAFAADVGARALREFDHNFRGGHQEGGGLGRGGAGAFTAPVETKHDGSVVTRVDRESEGALRELIRSAYPGDAILGEELGAHEPDGWAAALGTSAQHEAFRWILDPIDGTRSFVHGVPFWGVMITLERVRTAEQARTPGTGEFAGAVIAFPALGEVMAAGRGLGCWWKATGGELCASRPWTRCGTAACERLGDATLVMTSFKSLIELMGERRFLTLTSRSHVTRGWSDCYGNMLVATGRVDVMIDPPMALWDWAPLVAIIEEAGGSVTDFRGGPPRKGDGVIACANPRLLEEILGIVDPTRS